MPNKNPYELRTDLLAMAKDYLDAEYKRQCDLATIVYQETLKTNKASIEEIRKIVPQMYNFNDIMSKAQELYGFVSKDKSKWSIDFLKLYCDQ